MKILGITEQSVLIVRLFFLFKWEPKDPICQSDKPTHFEHELHLVHEPLRTSQAAALLSDLSQREEIINYQSQRIHNPYVIIVMNT